MPIEQLLRVDQVAEVLQVHPQTVYNLLRRGKIRAAKVGRAWRIKPEAIDDYLEDQMHANERSGRT
jgi:excisionase family DNA binding protein